MVLLWINADGLTPVAALCHPFGASMFTIRKGSRD
jgi:hypothetical protein